jgi:hypothetical protein
MRGQDRGLALTFGRCGIAVDGTRAAVDKILSAT